MAVDVASLALRVDALEVNQASEAMKRLQQSGADAEKGLTASTGGIVAGFHKIAGQAAVLVGVFQTVSGASRDFLAFDKSLALISTQLGAATEQTREFESASKSLALQFGTKLTDQSAAFYEILSSGITETAKATDILTEANKLAIGGNANLGVTIKGLTSILNSYGDKITSVSDVSDTFFTAALAGNATIEELAEGLGRVTPLSEALDVSLEELTASVAALTLGGVSARESITGIRAILAAVVKPTSEAAEEAKRLGLAFDANALKSKGFAAFLEDVKQKTGGSESSIALLTGGIEAMLPLMNLTGNAGTKFNGIMEQMANKTGIAQESFEKMNNSDSAKIDRLFAAVNSISITLGGTLSTILTPAAEGAASALNKLFGSVTLTGVQKQEKLIDNLQAKLERMKGINAVFPVDNLIFNKKDFAELEFQLENAKQDLKDLLEVKQEIAKPIESGNPLIPNDPPAGKDSKTSGRRDAISESQRFLETLQNEAREAGVTGIALLELKASYLGVADSARPFIDKLRESEAALSAQKDLAAQYARDLDKVKAITTEVATAEDVFIAKQNELNRLLSTGLLDPGTYFKSLEKAGDDMHKTLQAGNTDFQQLQFAIQGWGRNATDVLVEFATSGKASFSDFATSVLKDILRMYAQMQLITPLLQSLPGLGFGTSGGSAASTNAAASVFSNLFKGGRAAGGSVSPNSMYQVNERGIPEMLLSGGKQFLLTANQSGNVVPLKSSRGGNGGGIIVNLIESPGKGGTTKQSQTAGGIQLDIMVDQLVAKKQAEQGSASNKSLRNNFGLSNQLVMR